MARHRNQIKPDALKVTNAPKCESQTDVHERLGGSLISEPFKENVTLPSLWNIIDNVHYALILANGEMPTRMGITCVRNSPYLLIYTLKFVFLAHGGGQIFFASAHTAIEKVDKRILAI